jgi:hypothetical protein
MRPQPSAGPLMLDLLMLAILAILVAMSFFYVHGLGKL